MKSPQHFARLVQMTDFTGEPPPETIETLADVKRRRRAGGGRVVSSETLTERRAAHRSFMERFAQDVKGARLFGGGVRTEPIGEPA